MGAILAEYLTARNDIAEVRESVKTDADRLRSDQKESISDFRREISGIQRFETWAVIGFAVALVALVVGGVALVRDFYGQTDGQVSAVQIQTAAIERELGRLDAKVGATQ